MFRNRWLRGVVIAALVTFVTVTSSGRFAFAGERAGTVRDSAIKLPVVISLVLTPEQQADLGAYATPVPADEQIVPAEDPPNYLLRFILLLLFLQNR